MLIYDNLTTAVQKVLLGRNRIEQSGFGKLRAYYCFEARFCNPGSGHEKGGIEGTIGFTRRNYMVPVPEADTLEYLNEKILRQCVAFGNHKMAGRDRKVNELYEEEKEHLLALPETFSAMSMPPPVGSTSMPRLLWIKTDILCRAVIQAFA